MARMSKRTPIAAASRSTLDHRRSVFPASRRAAAASDRCREPGGNEPSCPFRRQGASRGGKAVPTILESEVPIGDSPDGVYPMSIRGAESQDATGD